MVHETIEGTCRQTNLTNDWAEYLAKREELRLAEIELMHQRRSGTTQQTQQAKISLSPPQHTVTRSAISAPVSGEEPSVAACILRI
jgi:hypothetical protein